MRTLIPTSLAALLLSFGSLVSVGELTAQDSGEPVVRRALPFSAGETHEFEVRFGVIRAGRAKLSAQGGPEIRGMRTMRLDLAVEGGIPFARVDNLVTSYVQLRPFRSLRFIQDLNEVGQERYREYEIFPDSGFVRSLHHDGAEDPLPSDRPLDDVSFLYYARTLPLEVGDRYELPDYFRESGNPVVLEVLRKDEITVPAGTYRTIVVQPTFESDGLFGEGGEAEVHFSDDRSRVLVKISSRVSRLGSLVLNLTRDPRRR